MLSWSLTVEERGEKAKIWLEMMPLRQTHSVIQTASVSVCVVWCLSMPGCVCARQAGKEKKSGEEERNSSITQITLKRPRSCQASLYSIHNRPQTNFPFISLRQTQTVVQPMQYSSLTFKIYTSKSYAWNIKCDCSFHVSGDVLLMHCHNKPLCCPCLQQLWTLKHINITSFIMYKRFL